MAVDLKKDDTGSYKLDSEQETCLRNKGYFPPEDSDDIEDSLDDNVENIAGTSEEVTDKELPGGYYEVESVSGTRINKDTHVLEYKVRFKVYSEEDDMWLPAGAFNQPVDHTSLSSYGRKPKHKCSKSSQSRTGKGDNHVKSEIENRRKSKLTNPRQEMVKTALPKRRKIISRNKQTYQNLEKVKHDLKLLLTKNANIQSPNRSKIEFNKKSSHKRFTNDYTKTSKYTSRKFKTLSHMRRKNPALSSKHYRI